MVPTCLHTSVAYCLAESSVMAASIIVIFVLLLALIYLMGFGPGGIVAGSFAAKLMSIFAPIQSGSLVAILQSLGAAGIFSSYAWILAIPAACISFLCCGCCL